MTNFRVADLATPLLAELDASPAVEVILLAAQNHDAQSRASSSARRSIHASDHSISSSAAAAIRSGQPAQENAWAEAISESNSSRAIDSAPASRSPKPT